MYQQFNYQDKAFMDDTLAKKVAKLLREAIEKTGKATLAVSGGNTPKEFFTLLSKQILPWQHVTITLADERWVDVDNKDSNTKLVHENLLQNEAKTAHFFYLKEKGPLTDTTLARLNQVAKDQLLTFDVLILGMGDDGHTASLFPCSEQIKVALATTPIMINEEGEVDDQSVDNNDNILMAVLPTTAPYERITFTFAHLIKSKNIFLQICGENKKQVLAKALAGSDTYEMPVRAFLHHKDVNVKVYWARL